MKNYKPKCCNQWQLRYQYKWQGLDSREWQYLTYPKIDREQTWNFSLIWSIIDFEFKILDQNATINGRDIINTRVKV